MTGEPIVSRLWITIASFACGVLFVARPADADPPDSPRVKLLRGLCEKSILDYPIKVRQGKDIRAYENVIISGLLKELLNEKVTEWVTYVAFTGNGIVVGGTYNEGKFSKRSDDEVRKALSEDIQRRVGDLFSGPVSVTTQCEITRLSGFDTVVVIPPRNFKEEFIKRSPNAVEFNGKRLGDIILVGDVWKAVLGVGKPLPGLEIDLKSEKSDDKARSVSTIKAIEEYDGFVTRYSTTVTMQEPKDGKGESIVLEVLVHGDRRRASAKTWTEFKVGESIQASGPSGHLAAHKTSVPLLEAISTRLMK